MTDFDLTGLTLEELVALEGNIKELKVTKREENKVALKLEKENKVTEFKGSIGEGDTVSFLYGRENGTFEGTVVRASEKSVTVKADVFKENGKKDTNYVRYDRIVSILEKGKVEEVLQVTDEVTVEGTSEEVAV